MNNNLENLKCALRFNEVLKAYFHILLPLLNQNIYRKMLLLKYALLSMFKRKSCTFVCSYTCLYLCLFDVFKTSGLKYQFCLSLYECPRPQHCVNYLNIRKGDCCTDSSVIMPFAADSYVVLQ